MKIFLKCLFILVFGLQPLIGFAEIWPNYSIVELSVLSDSIVETKFINKDNGRYFFLSRDIESVKDYQDTLIIDNIDGYFVTAEKYDFDTGIRIKDSDNIIIYLTKNRSNDFVPVFGGYRLLKDGQTYIPGQRRNPGKYSFIPAEDSLNWTDLKNRIIQVDRRINSVKELKSITDLVDRNQALFDWLGKNKDSFGQRCIYNDDCGWGSIERDIFKWIKESRREEDILKANQIEQEIKISSRRNK